jgi:hypothetical protein
MEVLRLHVEGEGIGDESIERCREYAHGLLREVGRRVEERRGGPRLQFSDFWSQEYLVPERGEKDAVTSIKRHDGRAVPGFA